MKNLFVIWNSKLQADAPLVKRIRHLLGEYSRMYHEYLHRDPSYKWEMQLSLIKAMHAIDLYLAADRYGDGGITGGQKEGRHVIDLRDRNRPQLKTPVSMETMRKIYDDVVEELVELSGVRERWSYGAKNALLWGISQAERLPIDPGKSGEDQEIGATHYSNEEAEKYRVLFQDGSAFMHPYWDDTKDALSWAAADTGHKYWRVAGNNTCFDALGMAGGLQYTIQNPTTMQKDWNKAWRQEVFGKLRVGFGGFSMTVSRCLYVGLQKNPTFHSAYTCGADVLCTGSIAFKEGQPVLVTNQSGHYLPEPWRLEYVINLFDMVGLKTDNLIILTVDGSGDLGVFRGKDSFWQHLHVRHETRTRREGFLRRKKEEEEEVRVSAQSWSPIKEGV